MSRWRRGIVRESSEVFVELAHARVKFAVSLLGESGNVPGGIKSTNL